MPPLRKWLGALFAAAVLALPANASAQTTSSQPMLLSPPSASVAGSTASGASGVDRTVVRERRVAINLQHLDPRLRATPTQLNVELFDGEVLTLEPDRVEQRGPGNYTWHGKVLGYPRSQVTLTVVDGQMAGTVTYRDVAARKDATFQIESGPGGLQSLRQIDANAFPQDHPSDGGNNRVPPQGDPAPAADTSSGTSTPATGTVAAGDAGDTVDVLVVYSNQAAAAAGTAIGAQIQAAIDSANTAYANSGITLRLRLVRYEQVAYNDSGNFVTDLNRLTNAADGYMDNVATLRNTYGADIVSLFVENKQYCGYAWVGPNVNYAFSVVNRGCATGNLSFVHELGHNFGALHDPYVDPSTSPYPFGHGLTDPGSGWRTVMAYNDACAAAGTSCKRIAYFSNPGLTYGSSADPLGTTSTSDNARVHNQNAYTVANFRSVGSGGCTYSLSPASASVGATATNGSFGVTAGSGCAWNSASSASWLTIAAGSGTSASGTLNYAATANAGPARSASITVGGQVFTVSQATGCSYALSTSSASVAAAGGSGSVTLTAGTGCSWSVTSSASWLTVTSAVSGTGGATVSWSVAANTGASRTANLSVGGKTFVVTQAAAASSCTYALSPSSASVAAAGGSGSVTLTAGTGCSWSVTSSASWLTVTSAASGTGGAMVSWSVAANAGGSRTANLSVGGATFAVTQGAAATTTVAPSPVATLSASGLNFGNQLIGTTSAAKSVTLKNSGGGTLSIASLAQGGANPGDFARSGTCAVNTALTAGQSCTVQYSFAPSGGGNRSASLAIATNAGTMNLSLSGKASRR